MKKVLTVLLTLIMAICLVNLNNSHTKAEEGNTNYTYNYSSGNWGPSPQASYNKGDKITLNADYVLVDINDKKQGAHHLLNIQFNMMEQHWNSKKVKV